MTLLREILYGLSCGVKIYFFEHHEHTGHVPVPATPRNAVH